MTTLELQRQMTAALIADDPTTAALVPVTRTKTASGGNSETPQTPRAPQTFKLSLLAYDQRPTVTVAGVERRADYHLIGPHDMEIAVGDIWFDDEGIKYEVIGMTKGWDYMIKAIIVAHVPREARM